jgi:hypothetical protein
MLRPVLTSVVLVGLLASVSFGEDVEPLVQQQIQNLNDWAEALRAGAPDEKLKALEAKVTELDEAMAKLEVPAEEEKRLREKYEGQMQEALFNVAECLVPTLIDELNAFADAAEAGAEGEKVQALSEQYKATAEKVRKLNLPDDVEKQLRKKHDEAFRKAIRRAMKIEQTRAKARNKETA